MICIHVNNNRENVQFSSCPIQSLLSSLSLIIAFHNYFDMHSYNYMFLPVIVTLIIQLIVNVEKTNRK